MDRNAILEKHYRDNYSKLVKRVYSRTKDVPDSEDIIQETFARALKYWAAPDNIEAWINIILNNSLRDYQRAMRLQGAVLAPEEEGEHEVIEVSEWAQDMMEKLSFEISKKPHPQRDILFLFFERDFKPREICEVVDATNGNIRVIITRFRDEMGDKYGDN